uniref:Phosphoprotein n=1 Tax=human metapneumovirus TaxID=162145 RepID=G3KCI8_9MONO|nr:P [Human metapneumovirus] [Human metapneumovirus]WUR05498.1 P [Human metapneumovirus] [Human metapneumovirus]
MSFPEGKDILFMGNEAAKLAEAFQKSLRKPSHRRSQSIIGEKVNTVSETLELPTISRPTKPTILSEPKLAWTDKGGAIKTEVKQTIKVMDPIEEEESTEKRVLPSSDGKTPAEKKLRPSTNTKKKVSFTPNEPGKYTKLEKDALDLLSDNEEDDAESSILTFEERDTSSLSIEARLESIEEKLSMILGLLRTLNIATAGPTAARDGIRDAMIGIREELIADIIKEAKGKAAEMMEEEMNQRTKIGNGSVKLTEKAKELNKIVEDESTSGESEEEEEPKDIQESNQEDDIYQLIM